ncbi:unnamed protein product [Orchesella dallaii]|uniref:Acyl-coenzyme A oxidase n=1 Tax=Orchesella dallaii TaxID=48710 RepID=A0ABP1QVX1_9HEXA
MSDLLERANQLDFLKDFPEGPLDAYRKQATFNWKVMTLVMEAENVLKFKHKVWSTLENDPLFAPPPTKRSLLEERGAILEQVFRLQELNFLGERSGDIGDPMLTNVLNVCLGQVDWSLATRRSVTFDFFTNAVRGQAALENHFDALEAAYKMKLIGCVALTEIGHGTNTRGMKTRATYDPQQQKFILHCPDFEAAKCWAANMGKTATHAFVMAQLYTPDGDCHGLHGFVIPIRDPRTMLTYPGVTIFDMGEKIGLNGLDNGVMIFDNYAVSRESLLSKTGSITPDGRYVSAYKDPNKRFGASLGNLSAARIGIVQFCSANMFTALTIAIRYSAVRRQFGNPGELELPVIEYQMQQWRLFPYLAASYVMKFVGDQLYQNFVTFAMSQFNPDISKDELATMGIEMHVLSSTAKPITSWLARDAIQECREACGGHGYLSAAGIGKLRNDNDANCTYEGDNNVLLQQASNWLITVWSNPKRHEMRDSMPLNTLSFLANHSNGISQQTFQSQTLQDVLNPKSLLEAYKWLVQWLLQSSSEKFHSNLQSGKDSFTARNDSQVYNARTLSIAFFEHYALDRFWFGLCSQQELPQDIRQVLTNLFLLYGYWSLEKHLAILYQGGYATGPRAADLIRQAILELCGSIKGDAVALVDAVSPPDFVLNSALGKSDGMVYKNLYLAMSQTPAAFERTSDWKEISKRLKANL